MLSVALCHGLCFGFAESAKSNQSNNLIPGLFAFSFLLLINITYITVRL